MQAQTPTVVAREAPRGGVRLVFCERGYPSLSIWCYCFLQLPTKDALVPALIWVLSAGRYPLHHSICLPLTKATWQKLQIFKIQYGGRPPFLKSLNLHISVKKRPILMKFGTLQQILNLMTVTWPKIEILKIQDGGGRHLENRFFAHNSSTDCPISAKFCRRKQSGMPTKATWQKLQIFKIQVGGQPPFWKSLNHHISVWKKQVKNSKYKWKKLNSLSEIISVIVCTVVRKSFYIYCFLLAVLNSLQSAGCAMLHFGHIPAGWWCVDCSVH